MKIQIWSDIQCPFCYIGKRNLEAALAKFPDHDSIEIEWKSFQLDPSLPEVSQKNSDIYQYLADRKGISFHQSRKVHDDVTAWAKEAGLEYNFDKAIIANSLKTHRIIQLAKKKGLGDKAEERFFYAYFTEGKDLNDTSTLNELGAEIGLTEAETNTALTDSLYFNKVKQDVQEASSIGVRGVPFFLFNQKYAVSGAQPVNTFIQVLEKSYNEWKTIHATDLTLIDGATCTTDGNCE